MTKRIFLSLTEEEAWIAFNAMAAYTRHDSSLAVAMMDMGYALKHGGNRCETCKWWDDEVPEPTCVNSGFQCKEVPDPTMVLQQPFCCSMWEAKDDR